MSSPFTFFRRNQHITMVGVVILSMIAFTISDMMTSRGQQQFVLLGLMLGGIVFAFLGVSRGRWVQYGISGALLGGLCGWILPDLISPGRGVYRTSSLGVFDQERLNELMVRRSIANGFMYQAFEKTIGAGMGRFAPQFAFYPNDESRYEDDLTFGELLRAEADELGIVVTDRMVSDYINEATQNKLTASGFAEIRRQLSPRGVTVTEDELFDAFRGEIKAQMAFRHLSPYSTAVPQGPEVYYEMFRRTRVTQRLNTARVDVDAFLTSVSEPSDAEIATYFAEHRQKFPHMDEPGSPGFRQPRKAKLAYLEVGYKAVEQSAAIPTDEEIESYYNENKERLYRKPVESTEGALDLPSLKTPDSASPDDNQTSEKPPDSESPDSESPDSDSQPTDSDEQKPESPAEPSDEKNSDSGSEDRNADPSGESDPESDGEPKASVSDDQCLPVTDEAETSEAAASAADEAKTEADDTQAAPEVEAKPQPGDDSDGAAANAAEENPPATPADEKATTGSDESSPPEFVIPRIEYMPLDDDLKSEIRDRLLDERVRREITGRIEAVMRDLKGIETSRSKERKSIVEKKRDISEADLYEQMRHFTPKMIDEMKALADRHRCVFVETPLLTFQELSDTESWPVGSATDPQANPFMQTGVPVVRQVFESFPKQTTDDTNLLVRRHSVRNAFDPDGGEVHYAWWITEFSESHVPQLSDPGIRDQVVLTWKRAKARELAKKRAEELAEIVRQGLSRPEEERADMATSLEGQSVAGTDDSPELAVRQTQTFSWIEQSFTPQMNFMQQRPNLELSQVRFNDEIGGTIRYAGDRFMRTVFEEIDNDSVGIVPTGDLSSFYVVQPVERSSDDEILRQQFLTEGKFGFRNSAVSQLLNAAVSNPASIEWERRVWRKYGIDRDMLPDD